MTTDTIRAAIIASLKRRGAIDDLDVTPSLTLLGSRTSTASVVLYGPDGVVIDVVARAGDDAKALRGVAFACGLRDDGGDPAEEVERLREERQGLREDVAYVGASCDRELTIDGVALRAARLSPTRHDVERLTRERDEAIALERERCAALVREIPACQPGAKATAARRWLDDRVAACVRAIVVDDETATCARASVRDAMERAKAAEADAARAREAYSIDLAGLRDALRRADDDRAKWRARVADVASERDALRAELEDARAEAIESERRLNAECSAMDDRDEVYRALRGADDGSDDIVALAEWRMSDLAEARAALRANLRCDECDELATRAHADTARFGCDAHGVGEGWADTTHAAVVRAALR